MNSIFIRPATQQDRKEIVRCVRAAYRKYIPRLGREPAPMKADYRALIEKGCVNVLVDGSMVCGCLVMIPLEDALMLDNVAVDPAYQGRDLGRQLLDFSESNARRLGFEKIVLYTNERMTENISIYSRRGYEETHRLVESGYHRVYMKKNLS